MVISSKGRAKLKTSLTERHRQARESRKLYKSVTGESKPYSDFLKTKNNPARDVINTYEFTFALDYHGDGYDFSIGQETVSISLPSNVNVQDVNISESIKQQVADIFRGRSKEWVYNHLSVDSTKIRGIEEVRRESDIDYNYFNAHKFKVHNNLNVAVSKGRKSGHKNVNKYNLNLWI